MFFKLYSKLSTFLVELDFYGKSILVPYKLPLSLRLKQIGRICSWETNIWDSREEPSLDHWEGYNMSLGGHRSRRCVLSRGIITINQSNPTKYILRGLQHIQVRFAYLINGQFNNWTNSEFSDLELIIEVLISSAQIGNWMPFSFPWKKTSKWLLVSIILIVF